MLSFVFPYCAQWAGTWENTRRGIHRNEAINEGHGGPRFFLLSSLCIMVRLTVGRITDQFHLINNLKQLPGISFDLTRDKLYTKKPSRIGGSQRTFLGLLSGGSLSIFNFF